jgi:CheY-like chemotaxis protein
LLDVSRIARGKINLELGTIDVREVVERVLDTWACAIATRGLELRALMDPQPLWITGDDARLVQVFDNLVGNALKFTPVPGTIDVAAQREGECAVVRVRDTGLGIPQARLSSIFEPFEQEAQDVARSAGGLGLGLALAKGIVELHHGIIEAHSAGLGAGAEVVVYLPLTSAPVEAAEPGRLAAAQPRRVLVVEDNVDAAEMLRELLVFWGHDVTVATTGREALEALGRRAVDVVLCDLGIPDMSGYEVARAVRADAALRGTLLVALTGYGQPEDRRRTAEAGFDEHLTKPVDLEALHVVLDRLVAAGGAARDAS